MKNCFGKMEMPLSAKNIAVLSKGGLQGCRENVLQSPFLEFSQKIIEYHLGRKYYDEFPGRMLFLDILPPFARQSFRFTYVTSWPKNYRIDKRNIFRRSFSQPVLFFSLFPAYAAGIWKWIQGQETERNNIWKVFGHGIAKREKSQVITEVFYGERELIQRNTATQKVLEKLQAKTEGKIQKTIEMLQADEERKDQKITDIGWALDKLETEILLQKEEMEELKTMHRELQKLSQQVQNRRVKEVRYQEILDNHMQLERMRYGIPD